MVEAAPKTRLSVDEYLAGELVSETRHEYLGGEVYAMVGASDRHGLIAGNLFAALRPRLRGTPCQLFMADMKLRVRVAGDTAFYYPDLLLSCDPEDRETYYRTRPCLVVEVLSETTERIDRREKLYAYTAIPTLQEYLLLSQDRVEAELRRRAGDGWEVHRITEGHVSLTCLGLEVPLSIIYEDVPLPGSGLPSASPSR
ncbi:Uma2 family endonuclease [Thioalkalivibrio paradoxus]|uniref:Putative restriction endonuclease domain-containing protein n=1 Tax=Thioalkalivibrio paradoxus ARh 1 TaxID=713585 RepID=W0DLZ6_9GAMM|nr:Uma2 family endonuclease [Thioalkalivibrio paradoxus]AHE98262.1 hypothetical protein THITH_08300 [Thioalkalivibrio paradoxus ARh 1]